MSTVRRNANLREQIRVPLSHGLSPSRLVGEGLFSGRRRLGHGGRCCGRLVAAPSWWRRWRPRGSFAAAGAVWWSIRYDGHAGPVYRVFSSPGANVGPGRGSKTGLLPRPTSSGDGSYGKYGRYVGMSVSSLNRLAHRTFIRKRPSWMGRGLWSYETKA